jgi:CBS domain containing-hemolysin-like protein
MCLKLLQEYTGIMNSHFVAQAKKEASISEEDEPPSKPPMEAETAVEHSPSSSMLDALIARVKTIFSGKPDATLKEAIEEVLVEHEEESGDLPAEEKAMLQNVLAFGDMTVGDIMIRRADIVAVPYDITLDALKAHIVDQRHTRVPVYKESLDHVEGFLHIKDLFTVVASNAPFNLQALIRPMLFVPPSMPILDLLVKMRRLGSHMAIVVDEHGGTDGLVTLEDLFEEIVGDIQDEHDEEEHKRQFVRLSAHVVEADAKISIETLERDLGLQLINQDSEEEPDFETLGGLIFFELGRVPTKGEKIKHDSGLTFEIMDSDARRISKIRIYGVP